MISNQKYIGNYVYNRSESKGYDGKRNGHAYKNSDEWIRNEGTVPAIIDTGTFDLAQQRQVEYRKRFPNSKAIETYLLSGKIFCGVCGSPHCGNRKADKRDSSVIVKYTCNLQKRKGKHACHSRGISRDAIESYVLEKLADALFDLRTAPRVVKYYNSYREDNNKIYLDTGKALEKELASCQKDIDNLVEIIMKNPSNIFLEKIEQLEIRREEIRQRIINHALEKSNFQVEMYEVAQAMEMAKSLLLAKKLPEMKRPVSLFVDKVVVYPDKIFVRFNFAPQKSGLLKNRSCNRKNRQEKTKTENSASGLHKFEKKAQKKSGSEYFTPRSGGASWSEPFMLLPPGKDNATAWIVTSGNRLVLLRGRWPLSHAYTVWHFERSESAAGHSWQGQAPLPFRATDGGYTAFGQLITTSSGARLFCAYTFLKRPRPLRAGVERLAFAQTEAEAARLPEKEPGEKDAGKFAAHLHGCGIFEINNDFTKAAYRGGVSNRPLGLLEPTFCELAGGRLVMLMRAEWGGFLWQSESRDKGFTWENAWQTDIPNPSSMPHMRRLPDGRIVLFHNNCCGQPGVFGSRDPLSIWVSKDGMKSWYIKEDIKMGGHAAYPNSLLLADGRLVFAYNFNRREVRFAELLLG